MSFPLSLLILAGAPAASGASPAHDAELAAWLEAEALEIGGSYELLLDVLLPEGSDAAGAGIPAPIVQLDVPPSVKLTGPAVTTPREHARNEYLLAPYELLLEKSPTAVPFELVAEPAAGETIGVNLVAYLHAEGEPARFLRLRVEVPLEPRGQGVPASRAVSDWGPPEDGGLLQIGDEAVGFELPRADGSVLRLSDLLGEKVVIVTTYRAHW